MAIAILYLHRSRSLFSSLVMSGLRPPGLIVPMRRRAFLQWQLDLPPASSVSVERMTTFSYRQFKGLADRCAALLALLLLSPLLLVVSLLVRWRLGAPILFRQQRPGYRGRSFWLLKFRSMTDARDSEHVLLPDAQRLTPLGRWLRSTSIDELPELLNILRGEMSFIGPRPLLMQYLPLYSSEQARRHQVKPGFSGWAQINGRNALSWEEKFRHDVWYVDHQSFWLDLRIFLLTIWKVVRREGISAKGEATMPLFSGANDVN